MANLTSAVAGLVTFGATVVNPDGGFFTSYDLTGFYDALASTGPTLPCFLGVLDLESEVSWGSSVMGGGAVQVSFSLLHFALYKKVEGAVDFSAMEPTLRRIIDNYMAALEAMPYLTPATAPAIHYSPKGAARIQKSVWGPESTQYHSIIFKLDCLINQ